MPTTRMCFPLLLSIPLIVISSLLLLSVVEQTKALSGPLRMPSLADRRAAAEISCSTCDGPNFSLGLDTYRVPMALYELNRARLVQAMFDDETASVKGLILLEGGKQTTRYDTDHEPVFRQESYFQWAFGVTDADVYATISLPTGEATLFVPQYDLDYEIFCGKSQELDTIRKKYNVDNVLPLDKLKEYVASQLSEEPSRLYLLKGLNTDSGNMATPAYYDGIEDHASQCDYDTLFTCMAESRVFKTSAEIDLMRYTHWVSSMAHVEVMRSCKVGMMEYQLESLFQHHTYTHGGCRHMSYTCICACGPSASILHYGHAGRPNNRQLKDGDIALLDMGAEYHCYTSDITCSFPVNGKFSEDQAMVYNSVLAAQAAVIDNMRPGVSWVEMHRTAERAILKGLKQGGVVVGDIEDMIDADLGAVFLPCGMGHLIGLDFHDVGGYAKGTPPRSDRPGLRKLRTARILEEGMVLTVEPGIYFMDTLLDLALANPKQSKFIVADRLKDFRGFGGVRLEDGVLVTQDGCENLTICPRTISEILGVMQGGLWPPERDAMPELRRNWVKMDAGRMVRLDTIV